MKKSTRANKLNDLLGITSQVEEYKTRVNGSIVGITEEEIQEFRQLQGLMYFLQAPALFTSKNCPHCGAFFVVSRKYVSFCSYTCIKNSLAEIGIDWKKGEDLEALANDSKVYEGNEPIWVTHQQLTKALEVLQQLLSSSETKDTEQNSSSTMSPLPDSSPSLSSQTVVMEPPSVPKILSTSQPDVTPMSTPAPTVAVPGSTVRVTKRGKTSKRVFKPL